MALARWVITAFSLFLRGEWRELYIRTLIALRILDIQTITVDELHLSPERAHSYSDSGREDLQHVLFALNIQPTDAIVDFGSGKGGALIALADFPFSKITGVEISKELTEIAQKNLQKLKISNVEIVCCDATDFTNIDEYNYIYFYNPFPCRIMNVVIRSLIDSLGRRPRKVTIIYLNPVCHNVILKENIFILIDKYKHHHHTFFVYMNHINY
jgi:SAM-dependent methyltransferase